jgi:hypothetical protein
MHTHAKLKDFFGVNLPNNHWRALRTTCRSQCALPNASQIARARTAARRFRSGLTGEAASLSSSLSGANFFNAEVELIRSPNKQKTKFEFVIQIGAFGSEYLQWRLR